MSKQLIIVSGAPYSGRTTWINKNYSSANTVLVDAGKYPNLYVKSEKNNTYKLFDDTIEDSRLWCLEKVRVLMEGEKPTKAETEAGTETVTVTETVTGTETVTEAETKAVTETEAETKAVTEAQAKAETWVGPERIVLTLIACRPDRWREFITLAIANNYDLVFKFPTNKNLFYSTKHNTTVEQCKFIESNVIHKFPKDKKEILYLTRDLMIFERGE